MDRDFLFEVPVSKTSVSGWGRSSWALTEVQDSVERAPTNFIARGMGRSYGDCAAISGGTTLIGQGHRGISIEDEVAVVGASVTLDQLLIEAMKKDLFLPVSPGTRYVTVGGAVAADVHGKNHHRSGSFGNHVLEIILSLPSGILRCSPQENSDVFWATIGGMGLTGIILEVKVQLKRVVSPLIRRRDLRVKNFDELINRFHDLDQEYEYSVAWIDTLARGSSFGRSVMTLGNHESQKRKMEPPKGSPARLTLSKDFPEGILNRGTMKLFNEFWYRARSRDGQARHSNPYPFFYPLDAISGWNHIYGKRGFIQYQFVVPSDQIQTLQVITKVLSENQVPVFLSVLKRFGEGNSGLLSFPMNGWTLAVDIPTDFPELNHLLDTFDELVIAAGGRVYLAKDSRVSRKSIELMYPRLDEFRSMRERLGLAQLIQSDLSLRLSI
jgi:decaprenylphospho-beta-D-ribofuranose 2-oxidase